jgi:hypothetical protein
LRWWSPNLRALSRHDPALGLRLAAAGPGKVEGLELLRGSQGAWTARWLGPQGRPLLLHGQVDPLASAARSLEPQLPAAWRAEAAPVGVFALLGLGLGWPALAAAARLPASVSLLLADPADGLFRQGLARLDLRPLWARKRLHFCFGEPPQDLAARAAAEGVGVGTQDGVLEAFPEGRAWALRWIRALRGMPAPAAAPEDLPAWLTLLRQAHLRGELL